MARCARFRRAGRAAVVTFGATIPSQAAFDAFLADWDALYAAGTPFELVFDMRALAWADPRYCVQMAAFVAHLKADRPPLLVRSVLIVHGRTMRALLWLTFRLQPPVAPVHVLSRHDAALVAHALCGELPPVVQQVPPYDP